MLHELRGFTAAGTLAGVHAPSKRAAALSPYSQEMQAESLSVLPRE